MGANQRLLSPPRHGSKRVNEEIKRLAPCLAKYCYEMTYAARDKEVMGCRQYRRHPALIIS
jgi:hypothetical protein